MKEMRWMCESLGSVIIRSEAKTKWCNYMTRLEKIELNFKGKDRLTRRDREVVDFTRSRVKNKV